MGGENCRVLRLRWVRKLAMYHITPTPVTLHAVHCTAVHRGSVSTGMVEVSLNIAITSYVFIFLLFLLIKMLKYINNLSGSSDDRR